MSKILSIVAIDLANIASSFNTIKSGHGWDRNLKLDFDRLVRTVTVGTELVSKSVYVETRPEAGHRKFLDYFRHTDFNVVTKELKPISLGNGETKNKANFDVEITYDICRSVWRRDCNKVFLFSGDSDFAYLLRNIKELNVSVTVISSKASISKELIELADSIIFLEDLINMHDITFAKQSI